MTPFIRWITFNLVGAVGMVVQLSALAFFNHLFHGRYLIASAAALELTLLHNFVWHTRYTWRDRRDSFCSRRQLVRFHLSSGLLSLAGNIALMRLLVHAAHLPKLVANSIAILCCSAANFWFSHRWAFSAPRHPSPGTQPVYPDDGWLSVACAVTDRSLDAFGGTCGAVGCPSVLPADIASKL